MAEGGRWQGGTRRLGRDEATPGHAGPHRAGLRLGQGREGSSTLGHSSCGSGGRARGLGCEDGVETDALVSGSGV